MQAILPAKVRPRMPDAVPAANSGRTTGRTLNMSLGRTSDAPDAPGRQVRPVLCVPRRDALGGTMPGGRSTREDNHRPVSGLATTTAGQGCEHHQVAP